MTITHHGVKYLAPAWVKFVAIDTDGAVHGFECVPAVDTTTCYWAVGMGRVRELEIEYVPNWQNTLTKI